MVDNVLWIRSESAMLGNLNSPSPFDAEGWFSTGDSVEVDGEWLRILGRRSEIINVGGEKVYPAEVESVLCEVDNIRDVAVIGRANPISGQVVSAIDAGDPARAEPRPTGTLRAGWTALNRYIFAENPLESQGFWGLKIERIILITLEV